MAQDANGGKSGKSGAGGKGSKQWLWLLVLPWIAMVWVPSYNRIEPTLWDFPFFYWYQLLWVLISAILTAFVYHKTKHSHRGDEGGAQ